MEIRPLDLDDEAESLAVARLQLEELLAGDPDMPMPSDQALLARLRREYNGAAGRSWVALDGRRLLGTALLIEDQVPANPARFGVWVARSYRYRGVGSALVTTVEGATDRQVLESAGAVRTDADRAGLTAFAARHGYCPDAERVVRILPWPLPGGALDALRPQTPEYEVRAVVGDIPHHLVAPYCALDTRIWEDSPTGSLTFVAPEPDPGAYLRMRQNDAAAGIERITSLALTPDGELVGFSDLRFTPGARARAANGTTIVAREHRGHRLGLALKVAGLEALASTGSEVTGVGTQNDATNAPMIAVNEALGFRVASTDLTFVKTR